LSNLNVENLLEEFDFLNEEEEHKEEKEYAEIVNKASKQVANILKRIRQKGFEVKVYTPKLKVAKDYRRVITFDSEGENPFPVKDGAVEKVVSTIESSLKKLPVRVSVKVSKSAGKELRSIKVSVVIAKGFSFKSNMKPLNEGLFGRKKETSSKVKGVPFEEAKKEMERNVKGYTDSVSRSDKYEVITHQSQVDNSTKDLIKKAMLYSGSKLVNIHSALVLVNFKKESVTTAHMMLHHKAENRTLLIKVFDEKEFGK
jgi:hypothetical protein